MTRFIHGGDIDTAKEKTQKPILDFSANLNPLGLPAGVVAAAKSALEGSQHYPDPDCRALRQAISQAANAGGQAPALWPRQIVCGNGAADLIFRLVAAVKPQQALVLAPTFAEYEQALRVAGCAVHLYLLQERDGFRVTDPILDALTPDLDMVFICNPNNPTGQPLEMDLLQKILLRCQQNATLLVLDECFNDFLEAAVQYTMQPYLTQYTNLFILKAFTKLYAMAGLRLGYGLCSDLQLLEKITQSGQPWPVSNVAQAAGVQALQEDAFVAATHRLIGQERPYLRQALEGLGCRVYGSQANYLFFKAPVLGAAQTDLAQRLLEEGILIRDCSNYHGLEAGFYRVAVRTHPENQALIQAMTAIIKE